MGSAAPWPHAAPARAAARRCSEGPTTRRELLDGPRVGIGRALTLVLIGAAAWLVVRIAAAVVETSYARYARVHRDPARVRRVRTQVTLIMRVVTAVVGVVAVAAMLLTFPAMRAAGASMLASAGILGIVAGVAAQSTLGNLFAGLPDRLRRHGAHRRHGRGGRRVGHGRGDHADLPDRADLGRAPDHDAGVVLHQQAVRELVARRRRR